MMIDIVIEPTDGNKCYGKYRISKQNVPNDWDNVVEVDDLDAWDVIDWRYENN